MDNELGKVVDIEGRGIARKALVLATIATGLGICNMAANAVNFMYNCSNESVTRILVGFPPAKVAECASELTTIIPWVLGIK